MDDEQLEDLKRFIDSRISQAEVRIDDRLGGLETRADGLDTRFNSLNKQLNDLRLEMLDGFAGVSEAIEEINKQFDKRLTKLEKQAA